MTTNDLIRELLELLEVREWLTKTVDRNWGTETYEENYCQDCRAIADVHAPSCRYAAAVKAAREYLATHTAGERRTH